MKRQTINNISRQKLDMLIMITGKGEQRQGMGNVWGGAILGRQPEKGFNEKLTF